MKKRLFAGLACVWGLSTGLPRLQPAPASGDTSTYRKLVDQYCAGCHNQRLKTGGLALDKLDLAKVPAEAETWEKVIQKLRSGAMPLSGLPRPDRAAAEGFAGWLENTIDTAARANPYAGRPLIHRMNRAEYGNAIRDLLALEVDAASLLPPDDSAFGFDNVSDVLGVSPTLQERYLAAASTISALAVGDPKITAGSSTYRIRQDLSQNQHVEGMPLGTRGGIKVAYNFPLDAEYVFEAKLYRTNLNIMRGLELPHQVEFAVGGKRIHLAKLGGADDLKSLFEKPTDTGDDVDRRLRVRVKINAGPAEVTAAFIDEADSFGPARLQGFLRSSADNFDWTGLPHLQVFSITGPFNASGAGDTPSRRKVFVCRPENAGAEDGCARRILSGIARRAYRQPVNDGDLQRILEFYQTGKRELGFEGGIQLGLERILASPKFAFRAERDDACGAGCQPAGGSLIRPADACAEPQCADRRSARRLATGPTSTNTKVSDFELGSRLSFFLWSSIPDETLLSAAQGRKLRNAAAIEQQVRRMLADSKSRALVENFAGQWLHLRNVRNLLPNSDLFPDFDDNLRRAMARETEMFFESVLREDRSVLDLLTADYTFVNERLAKHYGMSWVYGSQFRRVPVRDEARRGLLGQASILAVTSKAERTSPVVRGKWVLENLLGMPPPPPPGDVPPLRESKDGEKPRTMREQMAEHRANPVCASCHKSMDPVGFALENFDAVGVWRTKDAGAPIDASGELSGSPVDGVVGLRNAIVSRPEMFATTVTEKLMTYALGRGVDYRDMPAVRQIVKNSARNNYRLSTIILEIAKSAPFQRRGGSQSVRD